MKNKRTIWLAAAVSALTVLTGSGISGCGTTGSRPSNLDGFVPVPGGKFTMEGREITVGAFYMGRYQVTQGEWVKVMGGEPSYFDGTNAFDASGGITAGKALARAKLPVEQVSWYDALAYANKLSVSRGLIPAYELPNAWPNPESWSADTAEWGSAPASDDDRWNNARVVPDSDGYRLATEAQWEYAARGGNKSGGHDYSGSDDLNEAGWYNGNWENGKGRTRPVGTRKANELGLFDMSGNVFEWVWDRYGAHPNEPEAASSGLQRVLRGGSWYHSAEFARSTSRYCDYPSYRASDTGFRLVRAAR